MPKTTSNRRIADRPAGPKTDERSYAVTVIVAEPVKAVSIVPSALSGVTVSRVPSTATATEPVELAAV